MAAHLVSSLDVRDFGAETVRVGDLNGDGAPDLLFVQSLRGPRRITCLTATTIQGEVLWQTGTPSAANAAIYSDLPVQIVDWDGDGRNEVLVVRQADYLRVETRPDGVIERALEYGGAAAMVVLDGQTGQQKDEFPLPAPADDSFLFANLTGQGRRDLVVKDRYWNMWGVSHAGEVLWHYPGSVGHFPAYGDVDGDGRDEIFVGFALVDHDGTVLFEREAAGAHQDAAYMVRLADGTWRLLFGNHGLHCLTAEGEELWSHPLAEAQHVVAGRFRADSELQFAAIDRGQPQPGGGRASATLYLYDVDGREIWRRTQPDGGWYAACLECNWLGAGLQSILVYSRGPHQPAAIFDGQGDIIAELPMVLPGGERPEQHFHFYCTRADVWGDSREEIILFGGGGACVYCNAAPLAVPTLVNNTLYPGM
ncbi:hypothetical protein LLH23_11600 [bacterium]|nr:hypothetical protein [bacterium]